MDRSLDGDRLPKGMKPTAFDGDKPAMPSPSLTESNYVQAIVEAIEKETEFKAGVKFIGTEEAEGEKTKVSLVLEIED